MRYSISQGLVSVFVMLLGMPAFAISNITVMADDGASLAVTKLAREYVQISGVAVATSFLSKEQHAAQILEGSSADVLITSDGKWVADLQLQGLVDIYSKQEFARGRIALIGAADSTLNMKLTSNFSVAPIIEAMGYEAALYLGNPETLPEGKYAKQAMRNLGVSNALEPYTLYLKTTDEMLEQVTQHHSFAVLNYGRALLLNDTRVVDVFPANSHAPMPYYAVVIAGDNMDEARNFIKFLGSNTAKKIVVDAGMLAQSP